MSDALDVLSAGIGPLRRRVRPALAGISGLAHIALTFDDGPDPASTPSFLGLLDSWERRATFFLLGEHVGRNADLVRDMADRGHELGVHGWDHRCVLRSGEAALVDDLRRTAATIEDLTGRPVTWDRPPYGVLGAAALRAARSAGLRTVLWSAWGRDWERRATPSRIVASVERTLRPGGTVLLHDTDRTSATDSWRRTLMATELLLSGWAETGIRVGPVGDHGLADDVRSWSR
jgi:peptidoglycan/xylan/chitin deacetylase (PgdA/CDA1 family)